MKINLRNATKKDFPFIIESEKAARCRFYHSIEKDKDLENYFNESEIFIIEDGDKPLGTISYEKKSTSEYYIDGLTILPKCRGKGYAKIVVQLLSEKLWPYDKLWLVCHPENIAALIIYLKCGFIITGYEDNYFGDNEPRVILEQVRNLLQINTI